MLLGGVLALAVVSIVFLPETVSLGWHLLHGNRATFKGVSMPVPFGWWAACGADTLSISKLSHSLLGETQGQFITVIPLHLPSSLGPDDPRLSAGTIETQVKAGYTLLSQIRVLVEGENATCYVFRGSENTESVRAICQFAPLDLYVNYVGTERDLATLRRVLSGTRRRR